ncbi:hypothetical protein [Gluconobacter oxydans]|uniref:hypothetical protein n=1 Tax=Gluconobacter oxydans TaxID=442 RepID=UPI0039E905BF
MPTLTAPRRAPCQVLVLPFRKTGSDTEYALFRRSDSGDWQAITGGGDGGETPLLACATIPASDFAARSE